MKVRQPHLLFILIAFCIKLHAQDAESKFQYNRVALTVAYLNNTSPDEKVPNNVKQSAVDFFRTSSVVPDKLDEIAIPEKVIEIEKPAGIYGSDYLLKITNEIHREKIPVQMVARWFNRSPDGFFNLDLIKERGRYNATDNDYLVANASKRKDAALEDMGEKLLQKTYLLLIDYTEVKGMKDSQGKLFYIGTATGYLFRLKWDIETANSFYNDCWLQPGESPDVINKKRANFENAQFRVEYVNSVNVYKDQSITFALGLFKDNEKLGLLHAQLSEALIEELIKVNDDFKIKNYLESVNPITSKIGTKEGLFTDQRFNVMETQQRKNGLVEKQVSVVRVKKVIDNKYEAKGNTGTSVFYKVAGGKIDNYGMYLQEKKDIGLVVSVSQLISGGITGTDITCLYNLSRAISKNFQIHLIPGLYFYGDFGSETKGYQDAFYAGYQDYQFSRFSIGLNKDSYFGGIFHNSIKLGYGMESTELTGNSDIIDQVSCLGNFALAGAKFGCNLMPGFQLYAGVNYYYFIGNAKLKYGTDEPQTNNKTWSGYFNGREGLSLLAGIRVLL